MEVVVKCLRQPHLPKQLTRSCSPFSICSVHSSVFLPSSVLFFSCQTLALLTFIIPSYLSLFSSHHPFLVFCFLHRRSSFPSLLFLNRFLPRVVSLTNMAILGKFEVNIIVDGKEAREYDDDEEEVVTSEQAEEANSPPTVTRYVEAVSGAFFGFRVCLEEGYIIGREDHIIAKIYVDGQCVVGRFLKVEPSPRSSKQRLHSRICLCISDVPGSGPNSHIHEKLRFSDIQLCTVSEAPGTNFETNSWQAKRIRVTILNSRPSTASLGHFAWKSGVCSS